MIDTQQALVAFCQRAQEAECLALDTEFVWNRTYYPKLGVIQVGLSVEDCHLIDAPAIEDLTPLGQIISNPEIVKILHDAQQDLTILKRATGAHPYNVFDTRCAAGLAGMSSTSSLAELLENVVGVSLEKSETRTDWLQRPLSDEQVSYAIEDVCYLHETREKLIERIAQMGRQEWLREELATYEDPALYDERDEREQYERVKGAGRATPRERAIIRELAAWRETEARRRDRPRSHVISDEAITLLARRKPHTLKDLEDVRGLPRRDTERVLGLVQNGLSVPDSQCPRRPRRRRRMDDDALEEMLGRAMDYLRKTSEENALDAPFVAPRAEVRALVSEGGQSSGEAFRVLRGWRRALVGEGLIRLVREEPK